jgi:hypothetical protein
MSAPIGSQVMHFMLQVVQMYYIYYLVTKLNYTSLQPTGGCPKRWRLCMRRILVFVVVAALALAMAVPAFAASGNASCVGKLASGQNQRGPGDGGYAISTLAHRGEVAGYAQEDPCGAVFIPPR